MAIRFLFRELFLVPAILKIKDLEYHAWGFESVLGLHQVLATCVQADKDLSAWGPRSP